MGSARRPRTTRTNDAPTERDERESVASLRPSPWVRARIAALRLVGRPATAWTVPIFKLREVTR